MAMIGAPRASTLSALSKKSAAPDLRGLLVDDEGNEYRQDDSIFGPSQTRRFGEELMQKRRDAASEKFWGATRANSLGVRFGDDGLPLGFLPPSRVALNREWDGYSGIMAGLKNAAERAGKTLRAQAPHATPRRGVSTDLGILSNGSGDNQGEQESTMAGATYGSGADAELERKRRALALNETDNALSRSRIDSIDLDGSGRRAVERGRALNEELSDLENVAPRRQVLQNAVNALARAAGRSEYQKDFAAQAPAREYADQQFNQRYVEPARLRSEAAIRAAEEAGDSRVNVAKANAGGKVDSARLNALARQVSEMLKGGHFDEAQVRGDQMEPVSEVGMAINELRRTNPKATPEQLLYMLGDQLTEDEKQEAYRLLGGV